MTTRVATALAFGSSEEVAATLLTHTKRTLAGASPALVMVFASTQQPLSALLPQVAAGFPGAVVVGASTAGEFTEVGASRGGASIFALAGEFEAHAVLRRGLRGDVEGCVQGLVEALPRAHPRLPHASALLLLDALAGTGEEATLLVGALLGIETQLAGGAAGDDLKMQTTWVGLGAEVAEDAAVLVRLFSARPLGLGVFHAHQPFAGPLRVTRASGNVVYEIDGQNAWEVWKRETRSRALAVGLDPETLSPEEVGGFLLRYEAGLKSGEEHRIRAPLSRDGQGALHFACGMPLGTEFYITESGPAPQLQSAREAARRARGAIPGEVAGALVFDCICRALLLGDRFSDAVQAISGELGGAPLAGFETYGEIALDAGDFSGFHNTTSVVLAFPK